MQAVVTNIGVATAAGANVFRGPGRQLPDDAEVAIAVHYGADSEPQFHNQFADSWLTIYVDLHVRGEQPLDRTSGAVSEYETTLLNLRKQVHIQLMADIKQGLDFVMDTESQGAGEITYGNDAENILADMRTEWRIKYRSSINDPSQ